MSYKQYRDLGNTGNSNTDKNLTTVVELLTNEQKQQVITSNAVCVIDVYANWCGPCKSSAPIFNKLADLYSSPGKCVLVKQNIENNLANDIQIFGVPMFLFYKEGQLVDSMSGGDMQSVESKIRELLGL